MSLLSVPLRPSGKRSDFIRDLAAQTGHRLLVGEDFRSYESDAWIWLRAYDVSTINVVGDQASQAVREWLEPQVQKADAGIMYSASDDAKSVRAPREDASVGADPPTVDFPRFLQSSRELLTPRRYEAVLREFEFGRRAIAAQPIEHLAASLAVLMRALTFMPPRDARLARIRGAQAEAFRRGLDVSVDPWMLREWTHDPEAEVRWASLRQDPNIERSAALVVSDYLGIPGASAEFELRRDGSAAWLAVGEVSIPLPEMLRPIVIGWIIKVHEPGALVARPRDVSLAAARRRHGTAPLPLEGGLAGLGIHVRAAS